MESLYKKEMFDLIYIVFGFGAWSCWGMKGWSRINILCFIRIKKKKKKRLLVSLNISHHFMHLYFLWYNQYAPNLP